MTTANSSSVSLHRQPAVPAPAITDFGRGFGFAERRLLALERLDAADLARIRSLECTASHYEPGIDLVVEGEESGPLFLQFDGWAYRYRLLEDGRRQILDFLLPGDWYDLTASADQPYTASVCALTPCKVAATRPGFRQICADAHPRLLLALEAMRGEAVRRLEESVTMLGRLSAAEAMLMFLSRTFTRLDAVGLVDGNTAPFPPTQEMIGDHLGLSTVHVNRTLRLLKHEWGVRIADGRLTMCDPGSVHAAVDESGPPMYRLAS